MIWLLLVAVIGLACWNMNLSRRLELVELGPTQEQIAAFAVEQDRHNLRLRSVEAVVRDWAADRATFKDLDQLLTKSWNATIDKQLTKPKANKKR